MVCRCRSTMLAKACWPLPHQWWLFNTLIPGRLRHAEAFIRCLRKRKHGGFISKTVPCSQQRPCSVGRGSFFNSIASSWLSLLFSARVAPELWSFSRNKERSVASPLCHHLEVRDGLWRCYQPDCKHVIIPSARLTEVVQRNAQLHCLFSIFFFF